MKLQNPRNLLVELMLWLLCILFFSPLILILINSFKGFKEIVITPLALPTSWTFDNFIKAWKFSGFAVVFGNSLVITILSTTGIILLCSMAGYKLSRTDTKLSGFLFAIIAVSMMVPFQTLMVPIAHVAKNMHISNNIWTIPFLYVGYSCSLAVLLYHGFTRSLPKEIEESAFIDGCSPLRMYFSIIFPLFKPLTSTVAVLYVLTFWNDLLIPLILISKKDVFTIPLSQMAFYGHFSSTDWNLLLASAVMASVPTIILYVALQKYVIGGLVAGAVKS